MPPRSSKRAYFIVTPNPRVPGSYMTARLSSQLLHLFSADSHFQVRGHQGFFIKVGDIDDNKEPMDRYQRDNPSFRSALQACGLLRRTKPLIMLANSIAHNDLCPTAKVQTYVYDLAKVGRGECTDEVDWKERGVGTFWSGTT
jgi:hypothetical protein